MSDIVIDGNTLPDSMDGRGKYEFHPQKIGTIAASRRAVRSGSQVLLWRFTWLTADEYQWWVTTVLGGAESLEITATIRDNYHRLFSVTSANLYKPIYRMMTGNIYYDVDIEIQHILPLRTAAS